MTQRSMLLRMLESLGAKTVYEAADSHVALQIVATWTALESAYRSSARVILESSLDMAKKLDITSVAEGVDAGRLERAAQLGCGLAWGLPEIGFGVGIRHYDDPDPR